MAARKKRTLTPEEQLEAALVPESEWPYEVPDNWCWVRIGSVNTYKSASVDPSKTPDGLFELYSVPSLEDDYPEIVAGSEIGSTKQSVRKDDVLLCKINPRINRVWKVTQYTDETLIASSEWVVIRSAVFEPDYLTRCLSAHFFREQLLSHVSGVGGSLMRAQPRYIKDYVIPLPPLHEQRRIAARIKRLFAKLDAAEAELREVIDSSEQRQASILNAAFGGALTAKWREDNGVKLHTWIRSTIGECCRIGSGGTPSRKHPAYYMGEIPWIKTGEISWNHIYESEEHITQEAVDNSSAKLYQPGAVLVAMYGMGQTRGKAALLDIAATTNQAVCVLEPNEIIDRSFLFYFFKRNYWDIREKSIGGNQLNLSATIIKRYEICLPSITEQRVIAERLKSFLDKELASVKAAEAALLRIASLRHTILSMAMRGKLGTNDPKETSAKGLLLDVLQGAR